MNDQCTPENMTEAERLQEISRILATAIERMHKAQKNPDIMPNNSVDSLEKESVYA